MGEDHSWFLPDEEIPRETWGKIRSDVEKLIKAFRHPLGKAEVTDEYIFIDGGGEGFAFTREKYERHNWCKTFDLPYDKLVCAILCTVNHHYPLEMPYEGQVIGGFGSDMELAYPESGYPDNYPAGARWASRVLGREIKPPCERSIQIALRNVHKRLRFQLDRLVR